MHQDIPPEQRLAELIGRAREGGMMLVLLGLGNELRGDDAVGTVLARDLSALGLPGLKSFPVGISVENSTHLVARHGARIMLLVDAVSEPGRPLGHWDFHPPENLDSFIHSTHSVPLSLFVTFWKREVPDLEVHFIGINIGPTETFGEMCREVRETKENLIRAFRAGLEV